jgi:hypothetical protein
VWIGLASGPFKLVTQKIADVAAEQNSADLWYQKVFISILPRSARSGEDVVVDDFFDMA